MRRAGRPVALCNAQIAAGVMGPERNEERRAAFMGGLLYWKICGGGNADVEGEG